MDYGGVVETLSWTIVGGPGNECNFGIQDGKVKSLIPSVGWNLKVCISRCSFLILRGHPQCGNLSFMDDLYLFGGSEEVESYLGSRLKGVTKNTSLSFRPFLMNK